MNVPNFLTSSFILFQAECTDFTPAACNGSNASTCSMLCFTSPLVYGQYWKIKQSKVMSRFLWTLADNIFLSYIFVLPSSVLFYTYTIAASFTWNPLPKGHIIWYTKDHSKVKSLLVVTYIRTNNFRESPDNTVRPWNHSRAKMYVHMFTCKHKPWLGHLLGALLP